jgi:hypothetical protein
VTNEHPRKVWPRPTVSPGRTSLACAIASVAAYGGALATVVAGYKHALVSACPTGASAPAAFWPLLLVAVALAVAAFKARPRQRDAHGSLSGTDIFALFVVFTVPIAAFVTVFGYAVAYACWE